MTLVCVPGTLISRPQLSRIRYDALPVCASQANETLHDVLPVERRLNGFVGAGLRANTGVSSAGFDGPGGTVASRHAPATTSIAPATTPDNDRRGIGEGPFRVRNAGSSPFRSVSVRRTTVVTHLANGRIWSPLVADEMSSLTPVLLAREVSAVGGASPTDLR